MRRTAKPGFGLAGAILCLVCLAARAQDGDYFFAQLADTQFGAFTSDRDFVQETANYEFVVANLNRLRPAFVVICGDLINLPGDPAQRDEYFRVTGQLDATIPVYAVAGNHDVGNEPTPESLAEYREYFGPDYYSFRAGNLYAIVLNSSLIAAPVGAPDEARAQEAWLAAELGRAATSGAAHIVVFQHHPWFIESADEPDDYFNIPSEQRSRFLELLRDGGVDYVFAGHLHRNAEGQADGLAMITTGPVGRPLGADPSGFRIVRVTADGIGHEYIGLGSIPSQIEGFARRGAVPESGKAIGP